MVDVAIIHYLDVPVFFSEYLTDRNHIENHLIEETTQVTL